MEQKYTYSLTAIFALLTLIFSCIMLLVYPAEANLKNGYHTPVIALELAQSTDELSFLTGNGEIESKNREKMLAGQKLDMLFPFIYAGLIFFLLAGDLPKGRKFLLPGMALALSIIPSDLYENKILDEILFALQMGMNTADHLKNLYLATWLKWGLISASLLFIAISKSIDKAWVSCFISLIASLSILFAWCFLGTGLTAEFMMIMISVFFVYFSFKGIYLYYLFGVI